MMRLRRLVSLAVALTVLASSSATVVARSIPAGYFFVRGFVAFQGGSSHGSHGGLTRMCPGEVGQAVLNVLGVLEYRNRAGETWSVARPVGRRITIHASIADTSIASVSPASQSHGTALTSHVNFKITARQFGTTSITYTDDLGLAPPYTEPIEVVDCHYELTTVSVWRPNLGFLPTLMAAMINVPINPGRVSMTTAKMSNGGAAPPIGGCVVTYEVARSDVTITVVTNPINNRLGFLLTFARVPANAEVCHVPHANGGSDGAGRPDPINFDIDPDADSTTLTLPHRVVSDAGVWRGTMTIIVKRVPN